MTTRTTIPDTADHDKVKSWLQDHELKDRKLGDARSGKARAVDVWSVIDRVQAKAYEAFPNMDRDELDAFIRDYIDPLHVAPARPKG